MLEMEGLPIVSSRVSFGTNKLTNSGRKKATVREAAACRPGVCVKKSKEMPNANPPKSKATRLVENGIQIINKK